MQGCAKRATLPMHPKLSLLCANLLCKNSIKVGVWVEKGRTPVSQIFLFVCRASKECDD